MSDDAADRASSGVSESYWAADPPTVGIVASYLLTVFSFAAVVQHLKREMGSDVHVNGVSVKEQSFRC